MCIPISIALANTFATYLAQLVQLKDRVLFPSHICTVAQITYFLPWKTLSSPYEQKVEKIGTPQNEGHHHQEKGQQENR